MTEFFKWFLPFTKVLYRYITYLNRQVTKYSVQIWSREIIVSRQNSIVLKIKGV
jgi:hypothetical protein